MGKLKFDFTVKASADGKSNVWAITSITTEEERKFIIPDEFQAIQLHPEIAKSQAFVRIKNTLKKRHQTRSVWITLTEELTEVYFDEGGNVIFENCYLEEAIQEKKSNTTEADTSIETLTEILKKLTENTNQSQNTPNLTKIARQFMIEKFSNKTTNANQWITDFENECDRFEIRADKHKIELFKLFLEKSCVDWYSSMLIKLTIDSQWKKWKENFTETYANKGWTPVRYALTFKYQAGAFLDYAVKKERLLLEVNKTIDTDTLIDLIAIGLPNFVTNRIDRESLEKTEDLYNELSRLEHLTEKKKFGEKKMNINNTKTTVEKTPCTICEKKNKGKRYHPESSCWFKDNDSGKKSDHKIKYINNSELESELINEDPKN